MLARLCLRASPRGARRFSSPVACAEHALSLVHTHTGLPWWATLAASSLALRLLLVPSVIAQPRLAALLAAAARHAATGSSRAGRAAAVARAFVAECRKAHVSPVATLAMPLIPLPVLLTSLIAVRRLVDEEKPHAAELKSGGIAWFKDLTAPDCYAVLPIASLGLLIANLQQSFAGSQSAVMQTLRNFLQATGTIMLPFYAQLPAGLFLYWVPNSLFSMLQERHSTFPLPLLCPPPLRPPFPPAVPQTPPLPSPLPFPASQMLFLRRAMASRPLRPAPPRASPLILSTAPPAPLGAARAAAAGGGGVTAVDEELRPLAEAVEKAPLDVTAHVQLSKLLLRRKQTQQAVAHLWPAVQAVPREHSGPLRFQLALALALQGQHDTAKPLLSQEGGLSALAVLELEPTFTEAWICLSNCQQALGELDDAAASLAHVATLRPEIAEWCNQEADKIRLQAKK
ncbi:hypothetical protein AB1Y20_006460 [Prymnesium parvum]|uniref:Membrane insertase YidC/Oxa/ALB C-terminal domain-containing protein n=1 Tax=Prymnesium parvum TaxID=97485 RepID=A0AB34J098_PRYPA